MKGFVRLRSPSLNRRKRLLRQSEDRFKLDSVSHLGLRLSTSQTMMSPFEELNTIFENLLEKTSRFIPMAFHVHSPGSHDWAAKPHANPARNARARFSGDDGIERFLEDLSQEFKIVCITDHMKLDYACKLARASLQRSDLRVFPGMEVNVIVPPAVTQRIHLLVIFPPDKEPAAIERIFAGPGNFPTDANRTGREDFRIQSLEAWVRTVRDEGGILVAAHIDDVNRGHRASFRALREDSLRMFVVDAGQNILSEAEEISAEYRSHISASGVDAIEIMKPDDRQHFPYCTLHSEANSCGIRRRRHPNRNSGCASSKRSGPVAQSFLPFRFRSGCRGPRS
jgi:hypothetical protein